MVIKINKIKASEILIVFLVSIIASDFLVKIINVYNWPITNRVSGILKLLFESFFVYIIIKNRKFPKVLLYAIIIIITFFIGNFYLFQKPLYSFSDSILRGNIYYLNRYIFVFLFVAAVTIIQLDKKEIQKIIKYFLYVVYLNSFFILIGLLSDIEVFKSYAYTPRFGYSGLFPRIAEATHIYIIAISAAYYTYINNPNKKNILSLLFLLTSSMFLGTKAILLFLFFLAIIHFCFIHKHKKYYRIGVVTFAVSIVVFSNFIIEKIFDIFPFWVSIYKQHGFLTVVASKRDLLLMDTIAHIKENWSYVNYFFGGIEYIKYKVEIEWVDVMTMFGVVGVLTYISFFKCYFFNTQNKVKIGLLLTILIVSFFSGAMFLSVTSMAYLYILSLFLENKTNQKNVSSLSKKSH